MGFDQDRCIFRRVWIEAIGIFFYGWNMENFKVIGGLWGDVVCFDRDTEMGRSMSSVRIFIDILQLLFIEESIYLELGNVEFDIYIKDISSRIINI